MRQSAGPPAQRSDLRLQWRFHNTGQTVNGTSGVARVPMRIGGSAWGVTTGDPQRW